jgi:hypothetical protein
MMQRIISIHLCIGQQYLANHLDQPDVARKRVGQSRVDRVINQAIMGLILTDIGSFARDLDGGTVAPYQGSSRLDDERLKNDIGTWIFGVPQSGDLLRTNEQTRVFAGRNLDRRGRHGANPRCTYGLPAQLDETRGLQILCRRRLLVNGHQGYTIPPHITRGPEEKQI